MCLIYFKHILYFAGVSGYAYTVYLLPLCFMERSCQTLFMRHVMLVATKVNSIIYDHLNLFLLIDTY